MSRLKLKVAASERLKENGNALMHACMPASGKLAKPPAVSACPSWFGSQLWPILAAASPAAARGPPAASASRSLVRNPGPDERTEQNRTGRDVARHATATATATAPHAEPACAPAALRTKGEAESTKRPGRVKATVILTARTGKKLKKHVLQ